MKELIEKIFGWADERIRPLDNWFARTSMARLERRDFWAVFLLGITAQTTLSFYFQQLEFVWSMLIAYFISIGIQVWIVKSVFDKKRGFYMFMVILTFYGTIWQVLQMVRTLFMSTQLVYMNWSSYIGVSLLGAALSWFVLLYLRNFWQEKGK